MRRDLECTEQVAKPSRLTKKGPLGLIVGRHPERFLWLRSDRAGQLVAASCYH